MAAGWDEPPFPHSALSASLGSTRVVRIAGNKLPTTATASRVAVTMA